MDTLHCEGSTLDDAVYTGYHIPPITQETIECAPTRYAEWLNNLAEQVNYLACLYLDMKSVVKENRQRIETLEFNLANLEARVNKIDARVTNLENQMREIIEGNDAINQAINVMNNKLDFLYDLLPIQYGLLPGKGWKFAMGNINAMSSTDAPTDTNGPGIFTSGEVGDNDINFK